MKAANDAGLAVVPRGGGTKLAWGNPPRRADVILSTARLNAVVEHAHSDLTVTVEAGCTLQHLAETLGKQNQRLALDALWPTAPRSEEFFPPMTAGFCGFVSVLFAIW